MLRPWETSRAPVTAHLTIDTIDAPLAALTDRLTAPGTPAPTTTVDGQPITAAHRRELLTERGLLGVGTHTPAAGTVQIASTGTAR